MNVNITFDFKEIIKKTSIYTWDEHPRGPQASTITLQVKRHTVVGFQQSLNNFFMYAGYKLYSIFSKVSEAARKSNKYYNLKYIRQGKYTVKLRIQNAINKYKYKAQTTIFNFILKRELQNYIITAEHAEGKKTKKSYEASNAESTSRESLFITFAVWLKQQYNTRLLLKFRNMIHRGKYRYRANKKPYFKPPIWRKILKVYKRNRPALFAGIKKKKKYYPQRHMQPQMIIQDVARRANYHTSYVKSIQRKITVILYEGLIPKFENIFTKGTTFFQCLYNSFSFFDYALKLASQFKQFSKKLISIFNVLDFKRNLSYSF